MKRLAKSMAAAACMSLIVTIQSFAAVPSPSGSVIYDDGDSSVTVSNDGTSITADEIYNMVVIVGEDGVPRIREGVSPELMDIFNQYYTLDGDDIVTARAGSELNRAVSPKTGEAVSPLAGLFAGGSMLAGAMLFFAKERNLRKEEDGSRF
ncbi:MAG TPA: LPXTG cell wall anchor domain-containing protein [Candidatus Enterocloster excrementipullorum]|uniref:LPXTG cell wall anchor domain-containing protein n=1 Tax=Candidatus Enterocloster excrementipullorum TaxID=2838559 RepID=A0A9D2N0I4_9FIRM|nr:LPXTG cell wall anchor domain-containing protein [Candidatus Enterocloster excrementipullorum]